MSYGVFVLFYDIYCDYWILFFFFFKQKTAYEMRISDWSSVVCSSDLSGLTNTGSPRVRHGSFHTHPSQRQRPGEVTVCEGAGHARDLGRAGADGLGGIAPRSGDNRDFFDYGAYLRQRECTKSRCTLQEVDVCRQSPRLVIDRSLIKGRGNTPDHQSHR